MTTCRSQRRNSSQASAVSTLQPVQRSTGLLTSLKVHSPSMIAEEQSYQTVKTVLLS